MVKARFLFNFENSRIPALYFNSLHTVLDKSASRCTAGLLTKGLSEKYPFEELDVDNVQSKASQYLTWPICMKSKAYSFIEKIFSGH